MRRAAANHPTTVPHNVIIFQLGCAGDLLRSGQNADGEGQIVRRILFSNIGRERYIDSTIYLPVTLSWNPNFIVQTVHSVRGQDKNRIKENG